MMSEEKERWLDKPQSGNIIFWVLVVVCVLLQLADLLYHKHVHFSFEHWFGFYGFFGFVSCVALVIAAKKMRTFLMREEDYYDR